jgi:hypothetical protein
MTHSKYNTIFVSFHTENYNLISKYLTTSLKWLNLTYDVEEINLKDTSWSDITWYKPQFILSMLEKYPDNNIFWVDSDAAFLRQPVELVNIKENVAICYHEGLETPHPNIPKGMTKDKRLYHSGCIYATQESKPLFKTWLSLKGKYNVPDQYLINFAVEKHPNITIGKLPNTFLNTVHNNQKRCGALVVTQNPVVMHFIYSNAIEDNKKDDVLLRLYRNDGKTNMINLIHYRNSILKTGARRIK